MEPKVIRIEIKVTKTIVTVLAGLLLVALALLAVTSAGAHPPLDGPGGQGEVTVASTVPTMISYQGQLLDNGGNLVPNGTYSMTFKLYNVASEGTALWEETHPNVEVTSGLFNVQLGGGGNPLDPSDFTGATYLGVAVGGDLEMTPRQQMVSVPYAFRAGIAEQCVNADNDWDYTTNPPHMYSIPTGNVGIGTNTPEEKLHLSDGNFRLDTGGRLQFGHVVLDPTTHQSENTDPIYFERVNPAGDQSGLRLLIGDNYQHPQPEHTCDFFEIGASDWDADHALNWNSLFYINSTPGNVGIGTTSPTEKLDVVGTAQMTGFKMPTGASNGLVLTSDASGVGTWQAAAGGCWECPNAPGSGPVYTLLGDVGIGTTEPEAKLDVQGFNARIKSPGHATFTIQAGGVGSAYLELNPVSDSKRWQIIAREDLDRLQFWPGDIYFTRGGNVGIGTTTPQNKLDVEGAVAIGTDYSGTATAPADGMIIEGNVGIGTTSPGYKLHVIGSTRLENPGDNPGPDTLYAFQHSSVGRAGYLAILNAANPATALTVQTQGTGFALQAMGNIEAANSGRESVAAGASQLAVTFPVPFPNTIPPERIIALITPEWDTTAWLFIVTNTGFTVKFGTPPSTASFIRWFAVASP